MAQSYTYPSKKQALEIAKFAPGDLIIFTGHTGAGKSSMCNALLGKDQDVKNIKDRAFPEGEDLSSVTIDIQIAKGKWFGDSSKGDITVADTPGLLDSENRSGAFLVGLLDMLENFPPQRLRLIVIALPLTESRSNSTYSDMLELMDGVFRPEGHKPIWEHVCFVFTCANLYADQSKLQKKREGWISFLEERGVENPFTVDFTYGDPLSLEPLRQKFISLAPYTPKATVEMAAFVQSNPFATVKEKIEQNETWKKLQEEWAAKLEEARKKNEETVKRLEEMEKLTKMQTLSLERAKADQDKLEQQINDLRNRPPQIIHVPASSNNGKSCSIC